MKRLAIAVALAIAIAVPAVGALANSVGTNSWGCAWTGSTLPSGGTLIGKTEGAPSTCATGMGVALDYAINNTCYYNEWQWETGPSTYQQAASSAGDSYHQVWVPGNGYGQVINTYYPYEDVC
jgi:hypothetical protein